MDEIDNLIKIFEVKDDNIRDKNKIVEKKLLPEVKILKMQQIIYPYLLKVLEPKQLN